MIVTEYVVYFVSISFPDIYEHLCEILKRNMSFLAFVVQKHVVLSKQLKCNMVNKMSIAI